MQQFANLASRLFGISMLALSFFVAIDTVARKTIGFSFEGVDELGGYILAIGAALSFTVALVDRGHIRIDFVHQRLRPRWRALLDWVAAVSMAIFGIFLVYVSYFVIDDTLTYGSVAPTPWATPMIYPQTVWYAALVLFACAAAGIAVKASLLVFTGKWGALSGRFDPKSVREDLYEELGDAAQRDSNSGATLKEAV